MDETLEQKPPYVMAGVVALGALLLYVATLAPTTQFWDTSEYIAAAYVLGIPHPPGNPLFTILAHVWGLLPLAAGYAMRINLLAAVTSAVAAGCWFLVGERLMRAWVPATWPRRLAALAGAICSATAFTVWNQSVVNEKVYTLSLLSVALVLWLILRWDDQPPGEAHDHHLLLIVYLLALTATNHMMGVLVGPVVVVLLLPSLKAQRPADDESRRVEWSQWFLFCSVYAMIVATGLENAAPLKAAVCCSSPRSAMPCSAPGTGISRSQCSSSRSQASRSTCSCQSAPGTSRRSTKGSRPTGRPSGTCSRASSTASRP